MNKQRLAILIAASVGAISTFLPWANVLLLGSISGTKINGWNSLFYFAITIILCLVGNRNNRLKGVVMYIAIITAILAGVIGVDIINKINEHGYISAQVSNMSESFPPGSSPAIGVYLIVLAGFSIPFIAFLVKDKVEPITE